MESVLFCSSVGHLYVFWCSKSINWSNFGLGNFPGPKSRPPTSPLRGTRRLTDHLPILPSRVGLQPSEHSRDAPSPASRRLCTSVDVNAEGGQVYDRQPSVGFSEVVLYIVLRLANRQHAFHVDRPCGYFPVRCILSERLVQLRCGSGLC